MRTVPPAMTAAWKSPTKIGSQRPVVRATIEKPGLRKYPYKLAKAQGANFNASDDTGRYTSVLFGSNAKIREIKNIRSYSWSRSIDQDVADCTLTLRNSDVTPIGVEDLEQPDDIDRPGIFTYNRGTGANRWGYSDDTGWQGVFVPDRLVRTYEGYGADWSVFPGFDPNLMISGTWLIDEVRYTHDGDIQLQMRDVGRLLIDQIYFPPVVPMAHWRQNWQPLGTENVPGRDVKGGKWVFPKGKAHSSNNLYVGAGLVDDPPYVQNNGKVQGHSARDAIRQSEDDPSYWLSTGQTSFHDKVWWQIDLNKPTHIAGLRIKSWRGPYKIWISFFRPGKGWLGNREIPYDVTTGDIDIGANIPFVETTKANRGSVYDHILKRKYRDITKIRLTFSWLRRPNSDNYPFRAGLRRLKIYTAPKFSDLRFEKGNVLRPVGNFGDYSTPVKWMACWGGFFWPEAPDNYMRFNNEDADKVYYTPAQEWDSRLARGRIWGRIQNTGTSAESDLGFQLFEKQPLLDGIGQIRDVTGFAFWINECGEVVYRLQNIWSLGNWRQPGHLSSNRGHTRVSEHVVLDENETILSYNATLNSENIRERIFIADTNGRRGAVIKGYNPYPVGFRRMAGWTDTQVKSKKEARIMAGMIAVQQMFAYRRTQAVIPGYPAIQIDDQVRVFERMTNDSYYHYVSGITSDLDMDSGEWTYTLDLHWLGETPSSVWAIKVSQLPNVLQTYLTAVFGQSEDNAE